MESHLHELHELGTKLFEEGKYSEAEPVLKDIIAINPKYADVLNKLGIINHLKGNTKEAAEYFERALEINPRYTQASLNLAIAYNDMGEFKQAQEVFSKAAQIAHPTPTSLDPFAAGKLANEHYKLGSLYFDLGLFDDAIEEYSKALNFIPDWLTGTLKSAWL